MKENLPTSSAPPSGPWRRPPLYLLHLGRRARRRAPQPKTRTRVKTAADASAALDRSNSMPAGQDSPSTMLDLFGVWRGVLFRFDLRSPRDDDVRVGADARSTRARRSPTPTPRRERRRDASQDGRTARVPIADEGRRRLGF